MKIAVVYDCSVKYAAETADYLESHGYQVLRKSAALDGADFGKNLTEPIDLLVVAADTSYEGADGPVGSQHDYDDMADVISRRIYEAGQVVEDCLPALEKGQGKRIAFLTEECGSIRLCQDKDQFVKHMILAGMNMRAKGLFNLLRKDGYTMRCFAVDTEGKKPISAGAYVDMDLCYDEKEPYIHSDENRFVLRDGNFTELSW